jgi:GSH-dependent disulfide-bond oxidoreductase
MNHSSAPTPVLLELHGARTGNCLRAAVGLEEAGLAYTVRHVGLAQGEQRSVAHLALNPAGKVPVLVVRPAGDTSEFVLTQSSAILFYAADNAPGRLLPHDVGFDRVRALEAYFYFTSDIIALNGSAFILQGQGFAEAATHLTERYLAALEASERFISAQGFMGGGRFSIADIAAYTLVFAVSAKVPWGRMPRLAGWFARIAQRPAVQRGMAAFGA